MKERICTFILEVLTVAGSLSLFLLLMYLCPDSICQSPLALLWLMGGTAITVSAEIAFMYVVRNAKFF